MLKLPVQGTISSFSLAILKPERKRHAEAETPRCYYSGHSLFITKATQKMSCQAENLRYYQRLQLRKLHAEPELQHE